MIGIKRLFFACLIGLGFVMVKAQEKTSEKIPLEILFGNPEKALPKLSSDGRYLAFLAPLDGVLNLWVRDLQTKEEVPMTQERQRGIQRYCWSYESDSLLFFKDKQGDENWNLFSVSLATKEENCLTPFEGVFVQIQKYEANIPDEMLICMNKEQKDVFDLYRLHLKNKSCEMIYKNTGNISEWICDANLQVVGYRTFNDDGSEEVFVLDGNSRRRLVRWEMSEAMTGQLLHLSEDGKTLFACDLRDAYRVRLIGIDLATGEITPLYENPRYDVEGALVHPKSGKILAATVQEEKFKNVVVDSDYTLDFEVLEKHLSGDAFNVVSQSLDGKKWVILAYADSKPPRYYLFHRSDQKLEWLFDAKPRLNSYHFQKMEPISFDARDGLRIEGYLTRPSDRAAPYPLVLLVHGGPQARDCWNYSPIVQWLANRGYGVLQLNYRGSTGYGRVHFDAGIREWGRKMQDDLTDGVLWAIDQELADPKKIAIFGGSYGGYAALAGATFTPDLYAAAVDFVGPSNLITLLRSIPPYWKSGLAQFHLRVGNPDTEEEFLKQISPLFSAERIQIPLLIGHGANDPRVKLAESEQIVATLREKGISHEYVVYLDEGHGFGRPENRIDFYQRVEQFLNQHLKAP